MSSVVKINKFLTNFFETSLKDSDNEIYNKCYSKLASIVSHWFFTSNIDTEEFDRIIEEIDGPAEPEPEQTESEGPEESGGGSAESDNSGEE